MNNSKNISDLVKKVETITTSTKPDAEISAAPHCMLPARYFERYESASNGNPEKVVSIKTSSRVLSQTA